MRYRYHRPANPADFELLCLRLLQAEWNSPHLQLYGRLGEAQDGVDIIDPVGQIPRRAAQCKLANEDLQIRMAMIRTEVEKVKAFKGLNEYWILTTGKRSTNLQKRLIQLNQEQRRAGEFSVHVLAWEDLEGLLHKHSRVRDEFYPISPTGAYAATSSEEDSHSELTPETQLSLRFLQPTPQANLRTDATVDSISLLADLAERNRLVVVLGDVLDPKVALSRDGLAENLRDQSQLSSPDIYVSGSVLEAQYGRQTLLDMVLNQLLAVRGSPTAPYQILARLPISTVVSLFPDPVLEIALTSQDTGYRSIVSDDEMVVHELEPGSRELFLLGGSARFGTGLLLTQEDYEGGLERAMYLARGLRDRLALRSILLLGCDFKDRRFRKLFYWITRHRTHKDGLLFVAGDPPAGRFLESVESNCFAHNSHRHTARVG